jgi:hypothetical protein
MILDLHGHQVFAKAYDAAAGKEGKFRKVSGLDCPRSARLACHL